MPEWQGHACESPDPSHETHQLAQSPWCIRGFKLPYGLKEGDLKLEPISIRAFERGLLDYGDIAVILVDSSPEVISRIVEAAFRLTEHAGQQWLDENDGQDIRDFMLMALDTAIIWDRG